LVEKGRVTPHQRGLRDASRGDVVGADTPHQAASISKTVAALAERYRWPQRAAWPE
jgi:CubicO group peptidase (beta-lactamase class C family)